MFYSPLFPLYFAQLGHKFTARYVFRLNVSHMDTHLTYHAHSVRSYVVQIGAKTQANARVALSGAFMLTCNKIQNLIYENYRCLTKFVEAIVACQAALWVHYLKWPPLRKHSILSQPLSKIYYLYFLVLLPCTDSTLIQLWQNFYSTSYFEWHF